MPYERECITENRRKSCASMRTSAYDAPMIAPFASRADAGRQLSAKLRDYAGKKDVIILALVRGGVVIGAELARALHLSLFPYVVRKLGHPSHREYGMGAIAEGGATYMDDPAMRAAGLTWEDMEPVIEEETEELARRKSAYLIRARPDLVGKTIVLTDDGAATGVTLLAAIEDLRKAKVKKIVTAIPVCPPDTAGILRKKSDELVVLAEPALFEAVGRWYHDFPQVEDDEVLELLRAAAPIGASAC